MTAVNGAPDLPPAIAASAAGTRRAHLAATLLAKLGPLFGLIFVVALFSTLRFDSFLTLGNFELILRQTAVVGIAALGMTLIIISGGIDLSAGSAIALVSVCVPLLLSHKAMDPATQKEIIISGVSPVVALSGGLLIGALIGCVNGALITRLRLVPFIITLGMMSILRGVAQELADYQSVNPVDAGFLDSLLRAIDFRRPWLLTPAAWLMLALAVCVAGMLRYTRFGRHVFAIGSNEATARLCGVPVERTKLLVYAVAGLLAGVAGVLQFSYVHQGDPTTAAGMELDIIAAVVIGGASVTGGRGTVLGTITGALIMSVVANGCAKLGLRSGVQLMTTGGIIILAVALDRLRYRGSGEGQ